ncbi:hypothetical protein [Bacillus wiedmannii]|uniref:hypothetical protein n=1 Tax=Bacillus wiedmannii TaxID=1890302 RepID=UPI001C54E952|nr:hypothetical protein [Bacillus wiedmannii]
MIRIKCNVEKFSLLAPLRLLKRVYLKERKGKERKGKERKGKERKGKEQLHIV